MRGLSIAGESGDRGRNSVGGDVVVGSLLPILFDVPLLQASSDVNLVALGELGCGVFSEGFPCGDAEEGAVGVLPFSGLVLSAAVACDAEAGDGLAVCVAGFGVGDEGAVFDGDDGKCHVVCLFSALLGDCVNTTICGMQKPRGISCSRGG